MASHKMLIGTIDQCPSYNDLLVALKRFNRPANCDVGVIDIREDGGYIHLQFFADSEGKAPHVDKKTGKVEDAVYPKSAIVTCRIDAGDDGSGRVEVYQGTGKSFDQLGQLISEAAEKQVDIVKAALHPIQSFRKVQSLFESQGGSVLTKLTLSDVEPTAGVKGRFSPKVEPDMSEDALRWADQSEAVLWGLTCKFKTALGRMKLTIGNEFKFTCKPDAVETGKMLCRHLAGFGEFTPAGVLEKVGVS